ncbi:hypothetical protein Tco_0001215 [Tanacetum coccineum]
MISQEFAAHAPHIIEELFKNYMKNTDLNVHPTTSNSTTTTSDLQQQLYLKMKSDLQSQVFDPELWTALKATSNSTTTTFFKRDHDDYQGDDANLEGEKEQSQQQDLDAWVDIPIIDKDEVIPKEETLKLIDEFQNVDKQVPTIYVHERMKATIRDIPSNQFRDVEEYAYHLEQAQKFMENKNGNIKEKSYVLSLHKIQAISFAEEDLEEKMIGWVSRVFKTFNEEARLSIQHWKDTWHKRMYKIKHRKVRDDPEEVFLNHGIVEIVKVPTDQQYGLIFMKRIVVMRENAKQIKINLTAPTLTFPRIESCNPYSIINKPTFSLIYLNNKEEKRIIDLVNIAKFYDATLEKVLKEVKLNIFKTEFRMKTPLLEN